MRASGGDLLDLVGTGVAGTVASARVAGAVVELVFLGVEFVLELFEPICFRLIAATEFQIAQELGVVIRRDGLAVLAGRGGPCL
ncbi:hypothetical protein [Arthrobacter sp. PAMC25284]|uniref:hypothetical protein n=1 Tax=Arthrobacter sp. PAMC25284 TaxID=2861279 RepID=UPI0021596F3C|nr:hypothetical protein [Arthrobacter sp. PAMC25284]